MTFGTHEEEDEIQDVFVKISSGNQKNIPLNMGDCLQVLPLSLNDPEN